MSPPPPAPYALVAELTHRCPLHCVYCSNPIQLRAHPDELGPDDWLRVLDEAAALGVAQVDFSGGEPLLRPDLEEFVARARRLGICSSLITSGLGFTPARGQALAAAGLNSVQLSVQGDDPLTSELVAGASALERKHRAAAAVREAGLPLSVNVVLHRLNLDRVDPIIDLCVRLGAERVELASAQYHGWALRNRDRLLPTRTQVMAAEAVCRRRREELAGRAELMWVLPDYFERFPKRCLGGWARTGLTVAPDGMAYPCPAAGELTALKFPSVTGQSLADIWNVSPAFNAYRGTDWLGGPCRDCPRREVDFGGCRCQAFMLTGDAGRTDPVCVHSPDHHLVTTAVGHARRHGGDSDVPPPRSGLVYRRLSAGSVR